MTKIDESIGKSEADLVEERDSAIRERNQLRRELKTVQNQLDHYYLAYSQITSSLSWRVTLPLRILRRVLFINFRQFRQLIKLIFRGRWDVIYFKLRSKIQNIVLTPPNIECFSEIVEGDDAVIIFHPLVDWNLPLFQRPQHIAIAMAREGYQYVYCSPGLYDGVLRKYNPIKELSLFVTSYCHLIEKALFENKSKKKIMHVYAQDFKIKVEDIISWQAAGGVVLYEYIDAITDDLSVARHDILERHEYVLKDEKCIVVTTASNLYEEVAQYRNNNFSLITNGVDFDHFSSSKESSYVPKELKSWVKARKPIIGYFGALASWFDYEAVIHVAKTRPDWNVLLLGWDFDGSLGDHDELNKMPNVKVIGPIDYKILPSYAKHFSVATIPFQLNEITEATNPIKMFEYMALGKPIVTSDLPECRKYPVVMRYSNKEEFISKLELALSRREEQSYLDQLREMALANTWSAKGREMSLMLSKVLEDNDG